MPELTPAQQPITVDCPGIDDKLASCSRHTEI